MSEKRIEEEKLDHEDWETQKAGVQNGRRNSRA
jgi:hypothetical protein